MATNGEARESPEPVRGEALRRRAIPREQDPVFLDPAMPEAHSLAFAFQVPCLSKPLRFCFYDMTSRRLHCLSGFPARPGVVWVSCLDHIHCPQCAPNNSPKLKRNIYLLAWAFRELHSRAGTGCGQRWAQVPGHPGKKGWQIREGL